MLRFSSDNSSFTDDPNRIQNGNKKNEHFIPFAEWEFFKPPHQEINLVNRFVFVFHFAILMNMHQCYRRQFYCSRLSKSTRSFSHFGNCNIPNSIKSMQWEISVVFSLFNSTCTTSNAAARQTVCNWFENNRIVTSTKWSA